MGMNDFIPSSQGISDMFGKAGNAVSGVGRGVWDAYSNPENKLNPWVWPLTTAGIGAGLGALTAKKHRVMGGVLGGVGGGLAGMMLRNMVFPNAGTSESKIEHAQPDETLYSTEPEKKPSAMEMLLGNVSQRMFA